jgi:hypothetical protein
MNTLTQRTKANPPIIGFPRKSLSTKKQNLLWKDLEKRKKKQLLPNARDKWLRTYFASSPSTLATIREFGTAFAAKQYIKDATHFEEKIVASKPKNFVLLPAQVFGVKGNKIIERVYRSPSMEGLLPKPAGNKENPNYSSRFLRNLKKRLLKKGINIDNPKERKRFEEALLSAHRELFQLKKRIVEEDTKALQLTLRANLSNKKFEKIPLKPAYDINTGNVLVHDYDPKTGKVIISIIDLGGSSFT